MLPDMTLSYNFSKWRWHDYYDYWMLKKIRFYSTISRILIVDETTHHDGCKFGLELPRTINCCTKDMIITFSTIFGRHNIMLNRRDFKELIITVTFKVIHIYLVLNNFKVRQFKFPVRIKKRHRKLRELALQDREIPEDLLDGDKPSSPNNLIPFIRR